MAKYQIYHRNRLGRGEKRDLEAAAKRPKGKRKWFVLRELRSVTEVIAECDTPA
jgi:hypothetical protein